MLIFLIQSQGTVFPHKEFLKAENILQKTRYCVLAYLCLKEKTQLLSC